MVSHKKKKKERKENPVRLGDGRIWVWITKSFNTRMGFGRVKELKSKIKRKKEPHETTSYQLCDIPEDRLVYF